ncbi:MAG: NTP transferase domain-containing protein [Muribaculaceae bacterium]|nr:NTP transferase domain-containing protein [Muribaculaceae bacterium]
MKAFVLAAGLGTRLKPWTEHHPKALVPVGGIPMLERVIEKLRGEGFDEIVINVHHFASQIIDFLKKFNNQESEIESHLKIEVSDESEKLLDTGGGLLYAIEQLSHDDGPVLVHNVDILSNASLSDLVEVHKRNGNDATLLVSQRNSTRQLIIDSKGKLRGWINIATGEVKPALLKGIIQDAKETGSNESMRDWLVARGLRTVAFSGIHVINPGLLEEMKRYLNEPGVTEKFSIIDFYLWNIGREGIRIGVEEKEDLDMIDIGKPETLHEADRRYMQKNSVSI